MGFVYNVDIRHEVISSSSPYLVHEGNRECFVLCCGGTWRNMNKNHKLRGRKETREKDRPGLDLNLSQTATHHSDIIYHCGIHTRGHAPKFNYNSKRFMKENHT